MNDIESNKGEIIMYQPDETIRLEVRVENETVWLNRQQMASLFGRDVKTIGKHINNALKEELANLATVANFAIVQIEGGRSVNRTIEFSTTGRSTMPTPISSTSSSRPSNQSFS